MSTKLGPKQSSAMEIQVCSNEGPLGDNMMTMLKYFDVSSRATGLISTKLGTGHLWVKGIFIQMKGHTLFQGEIIKKQI